MIKLSLFFGLLMTINNLNSAGIAVQSPASQDGIVMSQEEIQFVELVNHERMQNGLRQLVVDPTLIEVAREHSMEMSEKRYFSHYSPTEGIRSPLDRYLAGTKWQPSWALVGENLFYCSIADVERGHIAFMNSASHRANILEDRYERIGVGIYINQNGEFYVTQMFLARED